MNPFNHSKILLLFLLSFCCCYSGNGQSVNDSIPSNTCEKRLNFYIFTKDADRKIDFLGGTTLARIRIKSLFRKKKLYVIVAKNSEQVIRKMIAKLEGKNAVMGNLWIDSHGLYKQGYSSFHIGTDEYSYKNIRNSITAKTFAALTAYCDVHTAIGLGSCYGGATFNFPGSAKASSGRMNGDSLMIGLGEIFKPATIYGSESWVMMKPGMFSNNFGFAGYPLGKRYRTAYWQPVWERLGQWNVYCSSDGTFRAINTVALDKRGQIMIRVRNYQELTKGKKAVIKNLTKIG